MLLAPFLLSSATALAPAALSVNHVSKRWSGRPLGGRSTREKSGCRPALPLAPTDKAKVERHSLVRNGDVMSEVHKADLELRIKEYQRKIEELSAFWDDPKINKIIRALEQQIAQDSYQLSSLDRPREV
jgi:hypothetical protein